MSTRKNTKKSTITLAAPVDASSVETKPVESKPVESKPVIASSVESKPVVASSVESKSVDESLKKTVIKNQFSETLEVPATPANTVSNSPSETQNKVEDVINFDELNDAINNADKSNTDEANTYKLNIHDFNKRLTSVRMKLEQTQLNNTRNVSPENIQEFSKVLSELLPQNDYEKQMHTFLRSLYSRNKETFIQYFQAIEMGIYINFVETCTVLFELKLYDLIRIRVNFYNYTLTVLRKSDKRDNPNIAHLFNKRQNYNPVRSHYNNPPPNPFIEQNPNSHHQSHSHPHHQLTHPHTNLQHQHTNLQHPHSNLQHPLTNQPIIPNQHNMVPQINSYQNRPPKNNSYRAPQNNSYREQPDNSYREQPDNSYREQQNSSYRAPQNNSYRAQQNSSYRAPQNNSNNRLNYTRAPNQRPRRKIEEMPSQANSLSFKVGGTETIENEFKSSGSITDAIYEDD